MVSFTTFLYSRKSVPEFSPFLKITRENWSFVRTMFILPKRFDMRNLASSATARGERVFLSTIPKFRLSKKICMKNHLLVFLLVFIANQIEFCTSFCIDTLKQPLKILLVFSNFFSRTWWHFFHQHKWALSICSFWYRLVFVKPSPRSHKFVTKTLNSWQRTISG